MPRLIPRPAPSHPSKPTSAPTAAPSTHHRSKKHKTISTASILKRKPMESLHSHTHSHRAPHRRRREKSVHPLVKDYGDDMTACLASAESRATSSLSDAHASLLARVGKVKDSNTTLISTLQAQCSAALAPLNGTEVDGAATGKELVKLGQHIETFRAQLAGGETELKRLWGLWSEAQEEIEKVGKGGYNDELKGWEGEVRERVAEMKREVGEAGREAVRGVGEAEKEIDRKLREDQAKLVAAMFGEE